MISGSVRPLSRLHSAPRCRRQATEEAIAPIFCEASRSGKDDGYLQVAHYQPPEHSAHQEPGPLAAEEDWASRRHRRAQDRPRPLNRSNRRRRQVPSRLDGELFPRPARVASPGSQSRGLGATEGKKRLRIAPLEPEGSEFAAPHQRDLNRDASQELRRARPSVLRSSQRWLSMAERQHCVRLNRSHPRRVIAVSGESHRK